MKLSVRERFDASWIPEPNTGCWLWTGLMHRKGYGIFSVYKNPTRAAHRYAWTFYRGPIPEGMMIDHMCRVRSCVNPDHLRVVTPRQNSVENSISPIARFIARTHCDRGHEYTPANTRIRPDGARDCRTCEMLRGRRRRSAAGARRTREGERDNG